MLDGFPALSAAGTVLVINPTGTVVAVVCALALGAPNPAKERATTAAIERVQIEEDVI